MIFEDQMNRHPQLNQEDLRDALCPSCAGEDREMCHFCQGLGVVQISSGTRWRAMQQRTQKALLGQGDYGNGPSR